MLINCWYPMPQRAVAFKYEPVKTFTARAEVTMNWWENPEIKTEVVRGLFHELTPGLTYMVDEQVNDNPLTPFFSKEILEDTGRRMVTITWRMVLCKLVFKERMLPW